jgi:hypothetical protein
MIIGVNEDAVESLRHTLSRGRLSRLKGEST